MSRSESEVIRGRIRHSGQLVCALLRGTRSARTPSCPRQTANGALFQIAGRALATQFYEQTSGSWGPRTARGQRARFVTGKGQKHSVCEKKLR
jgi:hypothetical protein